MGSIPKSEELVARVAVVLRKLRRFILDFPCWSCTHGETESKGQCKTIEYEMA